MRHIIWSQRGYVNVKRITELNSPELSNSGEFSSVMRL
jgi:hypothetical protein